MFLKRLFFFVLFVSLASCRFSGDQTNAAAQKARDSVIFYYKKSLNDSLSWANKKEAINKALFFGKKLKTDTLTFNLLYQKCRITYSLGEYDSLLIQDKMLLGQASLFKDFRAIARQHYLMGLYFEGVALVPDSAFIRYNLSKSFYLESKDSSWVGRTLLRMGTIQKDRNDFFGSKVTLTEALPYLMNPKDSSFMAQSLNLLATNHRKLFNYPDALQYYSEAISTTNSYIDKLIFKNNLAATYIDNNQFDEAIALLLSIVDDTVLIEKPIEYARVLDNLAYARWLSGKEKSEEPFLGALKIRKTENDKRGRIASYTHLGEFYSRDKPQVAKAYLDTVIKLSKTIKMPRAEVDALKFLMPLEPTNVQIRDRRIFLQDSLYRAETNVKTQFAKYKYDNQVSQDKNLRLEKENAERVLEIIRQRNQKIIAFLGIALLLTGIGFLYYIFKQRTKRMVQENKTAKLEATLETEAEMSRRLHDDFGAGLNQVMLMIQNDTDSSKVLDKLEQLYGQSRNFSREINEVDTSTHFKEEFLEMLRFRTPENAKLYLSGIAEINWDTITPWVKKVLYKVLQELMINMAKHSKGTLVTIGFEDSTKMLVVEYLDNGVGANQKELQSKNGLRNTEKRIQAIGGTITFDSSKGEGFRARIQIPK